MSMVDLKPCPFCGEVPEIAVSDDEGNIHADSYEFDPWSGLSFQILHSHDTSPNCPVANHPGEPVGSNLYDSRKDLIDAWNNRI